MWLIGIGRVAQPEGHHLKVPEALAKRKVSLLLAHLCHFQLVMPLLRANVENHWTPASVSSVSSIHHYHRIDSKVVNTEPLHTILLGHQHHRGAPGAVQPLYQPSGSHFLHRALHLLPLSHWYPAWRLLDGRAVLGEYRVLRQRRVTQVHVSPTEDIRVLC